MIRLANSAAANIRGPVLINAVVYAEFSIGYARIEEAGE
jgi:hypothetical protein